MSRHNKQKYKYYNALNAHKPDVFRILLIPTVLIKFTVTSDVLLLGVHLKKLVKMFKLICKEQELRQYFCVCVFWTKFCSCKAFSMLISTSTKFQDYHLLSYNGALL